MSPDPEGGGGRDIMMFVYVFTLFIRLSLIFSNMQMKYFEIRTPSLDKKNCQIVSLMIQTMQGWWFDDRLGLKSVYLQCFFYDFAFMSKGFH